MGLEERDSHSGFLTTGHEWNGITELNRPVPRPVYFFLALTAALAVLGWILMPAWPLGRTYTKGLLGLDQGRSLRLDLAQAARERRSWSVRLVSGEFQQIFADADLMRIVRRAAPPLFSANCAACHGPDGRGQRGFPDLVSKSGLWSDDPAEMMKTIAAGVNSSHKVSRTSQMPAFGRDAILTPQEIADIVEYVGTLHGTATEKAKPAGVGAKLFADNCSSCHGDNARGNVEIGSRNLTDGSFLYGGDAGALTETIFGGRQGHMPSWEERLSEIERKLLVLYLLDLRSPAKGG